MAMTKKFAVCLAFCLVCCNGCNGGKRQTTRADTSPISQTLYDDLPPISPREQEACNHLFSSLDNAIGYHLTASVTDRPRLLAEGLKDQLTAFANVPDVSAEKIAAISSQLGNEITRCEPLRAAYYSLKELIQAYVDNATLKLGDQARKNAGEVDPFGTFLLNVLDRTLQHMDIFSSLEKPAVGIRPWGVGIKFIQRPEYLSNGRNQNDLGRNPPYLVVDRVLPDSLNVDRNIRRGARIRAIESGDQWVYFGPPNGEAKKKLSYCEAFLALNAAPRARDEIHVSMQSTPQEPWNDDVVLKMGPYTWQDVALDLLSISTTRKQHTIGRLTFESFLSSDLTDQVSKMIDQSLRTISKPFLSGMILDLRNNLGGDLEVTSQFLGQWLPPNSLVSYKAGVKVLPTQTADAVINGKPVSIDKVFSKGEPRNDVGWIFVLTNRLSASASELTSMALQDYGRAAVLGEDTVGKGVGQREIKTDFTRWLANLTQLDSYFPLQILQGRIALDSNSVREDTSWHARVSHLYFYPPSGLSHHLDPVASDVTIPDPVMGWWIAKQEERLQKKIPIRLAEYDPLSSVLPKPLAKIPNAPEFTRVSNHEITKDDVANLQSWFEDIQMRGEEPESCKHKPGDRAFNEEDDCLLDWAVRLMTMFLEDKKV